MRILIIDDDKFSQFILKNLLNSSGHSIECAENGDIGLRKCKKQKFDLIILELNVPKINGLEFIQIINSENGYIFTPIIVISGILSVISSSILEGLNIHHYINKPFRFSELSNTIKYIQDCYLKN